MSRLTVDLKLLQNTEIKCSTSAVSWERYILASSNYDQVIRIWNMLDGALLHELQTNVKVVDLAFSHDGRLLSAVTAAPFGVSSSGGNFIAGPVRGGTVQIWDTHNGRLLHTLVHGTFAYSTIWGSTGKILALECMGEIQLWEVESGRKLYNLKGKYSGQFLKPLFSPDGSIVASVGEGDRQGSTVRLWRVSDGELHCSLHSPGKLNDVITSFVFSPDGRLFAAGGNDDDETIYLWDTTSGKLIHALSGHTGGIYSIDFNSNGQTLTSGGLGRNARLWHVSNGEQISILVGHSSTSYPVAFSPFGNILATASNGKVQLWDASDASLLNTISLPDIYFGVDTMTWNPNGDNLLVTNDRNFLLYELRIDDSKVNQKAQIARFKTENPFNHLRRSKPFPRYRGKDVPATAKQIQYIEILYNQIRGAAAHARDPRDSDTGQRYLPHVGAFLFYDFINKCHIPEDLSIWEASSIIEIFKPSAEYRTSNPSLFSLARKAIQEWQARKRPTWQDRHWVLFVFQDAMQWFVGNYTRIVEEVGDDFDK